VLRRLWTDELIEFEGEFHEIPDVGIRPLPVQQPIPLWMGGMADPIRSSRRVARSRMAGSRSSSRATRPRPTSRTSTSTPGAAGRDPDDIGLGGRMYAIPGEEDEWVERAQAWRELGADHLSITTMYQGLEGEEHATHLERVAEVLNGVDLL